MHLLIHFSAFQAAAGALLAVLSRRHYRRLPREPAWDYWSFYWACVSLYQAATAVHLYRESISPLPAPWALFLAAAAATCAPGFLAMAAWCLNAPAGVRPPFAGAAAVSLVALTGYLVAQHWSPQPDRAWPQAAALLLSAAAMAWFAAGLGARLRNTSRWAERFVLLGSLAWSLHLAAVGLSICGVPVYSGSASVYGALSGSIVLVAIAGAMVVSVAEAAAVAQGGFEAMWTVSRDCIRLTDQAGAILLANPAYCRMVGKSRWEVEGQSLACVYAESLRDPLLKQYREDVLLGRLPSVAESEVRLWDGRRLWLEATNALMPSPTGNVVLSAFRDVTGRKLAELALQRRERQLEVLSRAARRINTVLEAGAVMRALVASAMEVAAASTGASGLAREDRVALSEFQQDGETIPVSIPMGAGDPAADGEAWGRNTRIENNLPPGSRLAFPGSPELRNRVRVPVVGRAGKLLAGFEIHNTRDSRPFDDQDALMLEGLAASAAIALENAEILADQRRAEGQLQRSEQRYRSIVDGSPMGIYFYTLDSGGRLIFQGANPEAAALVGIDHERLIGLPIEDAFPALAGTGVPGHYRQVAETGEPWDTEQVEYQDERIAGAFEVHAFQTEPRAVAVMFCRITERKRAEEALRASEARYRLITDNSTDMISTHGPDGVCTFVSPACRTLMGYEPEELVGRNSYELVHPDDSPSVHAVLGALSGSDQQTMSYRTARKDGSWAWVETTARLVLDPLTGASGGIVAVTRDIAGRRELEEQFRQAQKLESVGRLAGGVAHDFNNILTVIKGYTAMMASELEQADPLSDSVAEIAAAGERAAALTQQLLAFSRKQVLQPSLLDLNAVISEAERMLRRVIGEDIDFRSVLDPALGQVKADLSQMQQVLMNLFVNARDAMPAGGRLTIQTANTDLDSGCAEWRPDMVPGPYIRLFVSDTGTGMDEATLSHIFEPFFTTKDASRGTGLGLSTVFGIVKQSGGHIWAESEPGFGTTFKVYLPRVGDRVPASAPEKTPLADMRGWETVLVVEDQAEVRRLVSRVLAGHGYRVLDAADADEALAICERHSEPIHLTVTDVVMPGMTGRDLADRLRRLRPEMRVLFISGYTAKALGRQGVIDRSENFLQKPFTPEALLNRARETLGEHRVLGTVLLVDDEAGVRRLLRKVLEAGGYAVLEAGNGREALARIRQRPVDLMLTDLVMPEKEGLDTIRELRLQYPGVRVIAMSGAFEGRYLKTAALMGARATIKKPVAPDELLRLVERVLGGPT